MGEPVERRGREILLKKARRLWSWSGAFTLSKVATEGIKEGKLSVPVDLMLVMEAIEVIPCSSFASKQLSSIESHES